LLDLTPLLKLPLLDQLLLTELLLALQLLLALDLLLAKLLLPAKLLLSELLLALLLQPLLALVVVPVGGARRPIGPVAAEPANRLELRLECVGRGFLPDVEGRGQGGRGGGPWFGGRL
jgi:hypothetical protein